MIALSQLLLFPKDIAAAAPLSQMLPFILD